MITWNGVMVESESITSGQREIVNLISINYTSQISLVLLIDS
jgi:hypothetical protein